MLAVGGYVLNINGIDIEQRNYTNDTDYNDEWMMYNLNNYTGGLEYWYGADDADSIGYWDTKNLKVFASKIDTSGSFYFNNGYTSAKSQWSDALGVTFANTTESNADIVSYGATRAQFEDRDVYFDSDTVGLCVYSFYPENTVSNGSTIIQVNRHIYATVYIISEGRNENTTKEIFTHEIGHALGYEAHSRHSSDVMYYACHQNFTLTDRDKNTLKQMYD